LESGKFKEFMRNIENESAFVGIILLFEWAEVSAGAFD
jgi:hypothetical protein